MLTNPNDYLLEVAERYDTNDATLHQIENHFRSMLARWGREHILDVKAIGSVAQGTSIRKEYDADLDLMISLRSDIQIPHDEIFDSLTKFLKSEKFKVEVRNISQRVIYKNVAVDVVPAIKFPGKTDNHWVWSHKRERQEKSNVQKHVDIIHRSGLKNEIKIIKIWNQLHGNKFPGFYLSLAVMEAMKGKDRGDLSDNILTILRYLRDKFIYAKFMDPSNTQDEISKDLEASEKRLIAAAAKKDLEKDNWNEIIY